MTQISDEKRNDAFENRFKGHFGNTTQHKDIHADGRGDQPDFHYPYHDDAEPDRVKSHGLDGGVQDRYGQQDTGKNLTKLG